MHLAPRSSAPWLFAAATLLGCLGLVGCGAERPAPSKQSPPVKSAPASLPTAPSKSASALPEERPGIAAQKPGLAKTFGPPETPGASEKPSPSEQRHPSRPVARGQSGAAFEEVLQAAEKEEEELRGKRPQLARPRKLDDERLKAGGLRKLTGKHLTLYTDLPSSPAVDELPEVWDQAYPQWCEFFRVKEDGSAPWHMRGFLMSAGSRRKFHDLDVIPPQVPDFQAGYTLNYEFFMYEQESDYYRRHLMLHEGTHGFMWTMLGPCTSPWYAEGTAELLGTHLWEKGKLTLRQFPRNREETAYHGRIKLVKEVYAQDRAPALNAIVAAVFDLHKGPATDRDRQEGYAFCWATAAFLDGHSRYRERFNLLCSKMRTAGAIPGQFRLWYEHDWNDLMEEWQVFVSGLEYGYDLTRNEIAFARGTPLPAAGAAAKVHADRGWQSAAVTLEAGKTYELTASGRVVLAKEPKVWESEADGLTIRYQQGMPLGKLVAAVRVESDQREKLSEQDAATLQVSPLLRPVEIGRSAKLTPQFTGTLYLKINDSPAELADNSGELEVRVTRSRE
jgi:hypothetical protein